MRAARLALAAALAVAAASPAAGKVKETPELQTIRAVTAAPSFRRAQQVLARDFDRTVRDLITLTEIPAPPFKEVKRAEAFAAMLKAHGLQDVEIDEEGNAIGLRKGSGNGPLLVIAAHLDTVFPEGTDVEVRRDGDRLSAPGIADDTSSLTSILAWIRAMDEAKIVTKSDILFVGNVGEEGPGDLRGVRYLFTKGRYKGRIGQFVSFESGQARITTRGVGSKRYKVTFKGPGGHSMRDFGLVNPAYAMANAMTAMSRLTVPAEPRTVYNVGVVEGGTSVNSIPFEVSMSIDLRSDGAPELADLEKRFLAIAPAAASEENAARSTAKGTITAETKLIGDRPVGSTPADAPIVKTAVAAFQAVGVTPSFEAGSTDSNVPMSLGIPAVTLRSGFLAERIHSLEESLVLNRPETLKHMAVGLATVLALAGVSER